MDDEELTLADVPAELSGNVLRCPCGERATYICSCGCPCCGEDPCAFSCGGSVKPLGGQSDGHPVRVP